MGGPLAREGSAGHCASGHALKCFCYTEKHECDRCGQGCGAQHHRWGCKICDYDICDRCYLKRHEDVRWAIAALKDLSSAEARIMELRWRNTLFGRPELAPELADLLDDVPDDAVARVRAKLDTSLVFASDGLINDLR